MIRRSFIAILLLGILSAGVCYAGPVLDEVLNYMFLDQTTPIVPKYEILKTENSINLTKDSPIGQTFVTGPDTDRIIRIRLSITPDADWQKGEGALLTLWDSPQKKISFGRYTIWHEYRGFQFNQPEFEVKAQVKPNTSYYFELSYVGDGDGKISRVAFMNGKDSYKAGQGYLAGKEADFDVCFQIHCKKPADRVGNLKKMFARFDLNRPELAEVKQAVDSEDFETAEAKLVAYFEARQKPIAIISSEDVPKYDPNFDTKDGDLAINNYFADEAGKGYAGPDINWRAEPDFNPDGTVGASGWNTGINRYGPRRALTKCYLNTGNEKYAKKMNDLEIDYYLDNPPPGISHLGGDGSDPVWATLDAGIRLANGFTAYTRIHASPNFTLDCRMAYFLHLADCADTLVLNGTYDGGNWGFTQNSAMLDFGVNFPEFTNSGKWINTAGDRIALIIKRDINPDGVEKESAPGYQRMSYNPQVSVYNLIQSRGLKTSFGDELKGVIEKQAEYFMYLAMPNGFIPYLGDWGNDDHRPAALSDAKLLDRSDMLYVGTAGKQGVKPKELSKLYPDAGSLTLRSDWGDKGQPYEDARYMMLHGVFFGSHGHSDLNGVTVYAYGRELLKDPGSYTYGSLEYAKLCLSLSHNLMTINGEDGGWRKPGAIKNWLTTPAVDYISSWVAAYKSGDYNREVFYVRSNDDPGAKDYWIIRDTALGIGTQSLEQRWHFAPGATKLDPTTLTARTLFDTGGNLSILQVDPSRLKVEETTIDSWVPRGDGIPASKLPTMIYKTNAALPAAIDTALLPYQGKQIPNVQLKTLEKSADGLSSAFKMVQGKVEDLFILQKAAGSKTLAAEKVTFDGERLFVRRIGGKLRSVMLANGSSVTIGGKQIIKSDKSMKWVVVSFDKADTNVYASAVEPTLNVPAAKGTKTVIHSK